MFFFINLLLCHLYFLFSYLSFFYFSDIRFIGVLLNQLICWFNYVIYDIKVVFHYPVGTLHLIFLGIIYYFRYIMSFVNILFMKGIVPSILAVNGLIVILGNVTLKSEILKLFSRCYNHFCVKRRV